MDAVAMTTPPQVCGTGQGVRRGRRRAWGLEESKVGGRQEEDGSRKGNILYVAYGIAN